MERKIYKFRNRRPLMTTKETEECWLGYAYLDFGGRYVKGIIGADGKMRVWYRYNSAYTDQQGYSHFIATLAKTDRTDDPKGEWDRLTELFGEVLETPEISDVQHWLMDLGFSRIEIVD